MKNEYTYTRAIEFDFDYLINEYELNNKDFETCEVAVHDYVSGLDDEYYYLIDNEKEIARDLYDYIQSKKN